MSFKATPSTNKVTYFKHFPHYFIRPYDAQLQYNQQEFLEKLNPKNCEWMTRPNIALSEAAQALRENWELVKNSNFLHPTVQNDMENLLAPMHQSLTNLDSKDKSSNATNQDVYEVMQWCFADPDLDESLSAWMQESAAFFVLLTQLRAIRGLVSNPQVYATKLVNDAPEAMQFKKDKTISSMQKMLTAMCVTTPTTAPSSRANVRALAQQLVDPSGSSSGLQPPDLGGSNIESTGLHRPVSPTHGSQVPVMPTPEASFSQQQTQPSIFTNQLMDMILSLQNQMQQTQQEAATQNKQTNPDEQPKKTESRKRSRSPSEACATSTNTEPLTTERRPKKSKKQNKEGNESLREEIKEQVTMPASKDQRIGEKQPMKTQSETRGRCPTESGPTTAYTEPSTKDTRTKKGKKQNNEEKQSEVQKVKEPVTVTYQANKPSTSAEYTSPTHEQAQKTSHKKSKKEKR